MSVHIDHLGIVVADLDQAIARLSPLLGTPDVVKELPEVGLRVAEIHAANLTIELLQYTDRGDVAFARRTMGEQPGLNHVSVRVDDVYASVAALAGHGFAPMDGFPRRGSHGRVAFFHPDPVTGLLFEVCQPYE
jgi:methylmalonyl-CoA epimerase